MGELIKLKVVQAPAFTDTTEMLNSWWKTQKAKPLVKPARIRHIVELAINAGWTLEDCYSALDTTWAFTESAFETALRKQKEEKQIIRMFKQLQATFKKLIIIIVIVT